MTARQVTGFAWQPDLLKGPRQRPTKPPPAKEFAVQVMVADNLRRFIRPGWDFTHFPAGELRTEATGKKLARMGLMPGWPDFVLIAPDSTFYGLELKRAKRGRLTEDQSEFAARCRRRGTPYEVAAGYREAMAVLQRWGAVPSSIEFR